MICMPRNNFIILQFEQLVSRETKPLEKNPAMKDTQHSDQGNKDYAESMTMN